MKKLIILFLFLNFFDTNAQISNININVSNIGSQRKYRQLVEDAVKLLNEILNSKEFETRILDSKFDWVDVAEGGISKIENNQLVYDTLFKAKGDYSMQLTLTKMNLRYIKFWGSGTVGVTSLYQQSTITFLKSWIDISPSEYQNTLIIYASHIAHEYCHQIGFTDKKYNQPSFRNVVPYAIGDIFCDLANAKFKTQCECKD